MKLLILAIAAVWSVIGLVFYWSMFFKSVKRQPQKIVFYIICGPVFWITAPLILVLDFIAEKVFGPLYNWLTKE
jgi:hypothetical protein